MSIFGSDWKKLHKKVSREYELIALKKYESGKSSSFVVDVPGIIQEIISDRFPNLSSGEAANFVEEEYKCFQKFDVRENIADALRQMNPDVPEAGISEIFDAIRRRFHDSEREHEYFLFFIISKLIELNNLSISRGAYLIEISRGHIPKPSRIFRFFQMWRHFARYETAKKRKESNKIIRLREISKKLWVKPDGGESLIHDFVTGGFDAIDPILEQREQAIEELIELAHDDPEVSKVISKYAVSDEDLREIYWKLIRYGAGIPARGHWVAASTLAFPQTLEYVLKNRDTDDFRNVAFRLRLYFDRNEVGEIVD